jgi:hypothetical protein
MTTNQKVFTETTKCGHCANSAPMEIVASHSQVDSHEEEGAYWEAGLVYQLTECPACRGITLRNFYYHDADDPEEFDHKVLFPLQRANPAGLPTTILKGWEAAARVKQIDTNAYGVLLRRLLELVCADRGANGKMLNDQLADLAQKGEIPSKLVDVARGLRRLSNVGAHALLGDLTPAEAPILEDLCRAVLEYVYSAPYLAQQAEERLAKLNKSEAAQDS